jgi:acetate---CoA ligase (ADP-forming)
MPPAAAYPSSDEVDVALRDGATVHVRPARREDEPAVLSFLQALSQASRTFRFFSAASDLEQAARAAVDVDYSSAYSLVATSGAARAIVGQANYVTETDGRAEVAFAIADSWHGRGLATILLAHLAEAATARGIDTFTAEVLPANHRMIEVFRESGFPVAVRSSPDALHVEFPTELSPAGRDRFERRDQTAAIAAVRRILAPRSVAVIGASRRRGTVGGELLHNLVDGGFAGVVYPINPHADSVQAIAAYPSVRDVPGAVELAVIAVPAEAVLDAARDCAAAGVGGLVVISAGFAESGEAGVARQRELLDVCRRAGMRLVGPNCLGVLNTHPDVRLNATFMPRRPTPGRVAFLSQSGGLGIAIIDAANTLGLGLSSFVSVGDKADISGNDLVQFWESDESTDLILIYLESFGNARKFARVARRVARSKPLLAVKAGRSAAGARATSSHTGALLAASDVTVDALFRQAGVTRTDTLAELFDAAALMSAQPPPRGRRVAIVTNAGGPGILCADACEASGLEVVDVPEGLRARLAEFLPAEASLANPIDMIATASAEDYARTIDAVAVAGVADAIVSIFVSPLVTDPDDVAHAVHEAAARHVAELTFASVFMSREGSPAGLRAGEVRVPSYVFPEDAARALGHAARYGAWRAAPVGSVPELAGCHGDEAAAVIAQALGRDPGWMDPVAAERLLRCYDLPLARSLRVPDAEAAVRAAHEIGGRVALKAVATGLVHKTDVGGVRLSLKPADVAGAAREIGDAARAGGYEVEGFVVQEMVPPGVELLIGVVQDPTFGPVVACGAGGVTAELINDAVVRITPLTDRDAAEMPRSLQTFPLLEGYRGSPRCDVAAVEEILLRVSALVEAHPEIVELDLNPVTALPDRAVAVDARVRIEPAPARPPSPSLGT